MQLFTFFKEPAFEKLWIVPIFRAKFDIVMFRFCESRIISVMKRIGLLALALSMGLGLNAQNADYEVVAHRGGALIGNENTLSAFENGIAAGADIVELDVHLTRDGEVVVCHDMSLDRTTDRKGKIGEMTLAEFKEARALDRESGEVTEEALPTLAEALDLMKGRVEVLIEIKYFKKVDYTGIEEKVLQIVESCGMHDQVIIQSFDDSVVETVHRLDPTMRVEKLIFCRLPFGLCFDGGIRKFSFEKYDYCDAINPMYRFASKSFIRDCHKAGKKIRVWTVNKTKDLPEGVDAVITNRPDLF